MIKFIDSNCMIGIRAHAREGSVKTLDELYELYDRCGIERALVYHSIAKSDDARIGNRKLGEEVGSDERLMRQWVVMPNTAGGFAEPEELIAQMRENNVHSVRMYPKSYDFSIKPYASGKLLECLEEHRLPLFIDMNEIAWEELFELCGRYKKLPVVICSLDYSCSRQLYPIMDKCKNLYIETSTYVPHDGIAEAVKRFGAERLIFGSGLPQGSACGAVTLIRYADISEKEKQMIARENILKLLGEAQL